MKAEFMHRSGETKMRKFLKWAASLLGLLLAVAVLVFAYAWVKTERALARSYVANDPALAMQRDPATLARGAHLFATRGCADCHGADASGKLVFEAGPVMKIVGPNLTPGGVIAGNTPDQVAAAIRHGVKPDGHPMVFMPSAEFTRLGDDDTVALVAWLQSLPASANDPGALEIRPVGRIMYALGKLPLFPAEVIDHAPRARSAPPIAATAEYGHYLAHGCVGCHGEALAGQHVPGTPPSFPDSRNLTPTGLGHWKAADFHRALREGKRPDGSAIDPFMPWPAYSKLSDVEIDALWAYLQTLPATPTGT
jgi:mono/diheme cytochrome c family protein